MIWVLILLLALLSTWFVIQPLIASAGAPDATSSSLDVYRNQLSEVDADLSRGLITVAEAEAARIEIKRRILNLEAAHDAGALQKVSVSFSAGIALASAGLALLLYVQLGRPAMPGHPYSLREEQAAVEKAAENEMGAMISKLTAHLATAPEDLQGWKALGWAYMQTGQTAQGVEALARAATLAPKDASVLSMYGEALVQQGGGKVSTQALEVFERVLAIAPTEPRARYYKGLQLSQAGKTREALDIWISVIKDSPPDAEWLPSIREQAKQLADQLKLEPGTVP